MLFSHKNIIIYLLLRHTKYNPLIENWKIAQKNMLKAAINDNFTQQDIKILNKHIQAIKRKEEQILKLHQEKLTQKVHKIQEIEMQWVEKLVGKNEQNHNRIKNAKKKKEEFLNQLLKKYKQKSKLFTKKQQQIRTSKNKSLNEAWKKAKQFNSDILKHNLSRTTFRNTTSTYYLASKGENSRFENNRFCENFQKDIHVSHNSNQNDKSNCQNQNSLRSSQQCESFVLRYRRNQSLDSVNAKNLCKAKNSIGVLQKFKIISEKQQKTRIQQFGQKLEKIQKLKIRKFETKGRHKNKQNIDKISEDFVQNDMTTTVQKGVKYKKAYETIRLQIKSREQSRKTQFSNKKHQSLFQSPFESRNKRRDRTDEYKQKRDQKFNQHLKLGSEHLQNSKNRHLLTKIKKMVIKDLRQKRFFQQRVSHYA